MLAMAAMPGLGLTGIYGSVIVGGLFGLLVAPVMQHALRFFPSVVTGTIITMIGISLMRVGIAWAGGGAAAADFGAGGYLAIAALVLGIILVIIKFASGFLQNMSVLIGIVVGYLTTIALGWTDFSGIQQEPWIRIVLPLQFGFPTFSLIPCMIMCLVMTIVFIEATGMFLALGAMTGRKMEPKDITRGLRADSLGTLIGGSFSTPSPTCRTPRTSASSAVTGVYSRWGLRDRWSDHAGARPGAENGLHRRLGAAMRAGRRRLYHVRDGRRDRDQDPVHRRLQRATQQRADRGDLHRVWGSSRSSRPTSSASCRSI